MNQLPPLGPKDKFTPEMRILVASLLSMAVIILYMKFFGPKPPVNPPQQNQAAQTAPATPGANATPAPSTGALLLPLLLRINAIDGFRCNGESGGRIAGTHDCGGKRVVSRGIFEPRARW